MPDIMSFTMNDYNKEASVFSINVQDVNPANLADLLTKRDALKTAIDAITRGIFVQSTVTDKATYNSASTPAGDTQANREIKWLITYEDGTEFLDAPDDTIYNAGFRKVFKLELGTANLALRQDNDSVVYTRGGAHNVQAVADFVTALEAVLKSPYGGVGVVLRIEDVGRSS